MSYSDKNLELPAGIAPGHGALLRLGRDSPLSWRRSVDARKRYWITPPDIYQKLEDEFGPFDFDPCPHPRPGDFNGLEMDWGRMSYVNPPFRQHDGVNGKGPTAFVHKAIEQRNKGRGSVLVLPVQSYVMLLAAAGAEIRSLGRVKWLEADTGEPMKGPSPICAFILRP